MSARRRKLGRPGRNPRFFAFGGCGCCGTPPAPGYYYRGGAPGPNKLLGFAWTSGAKGTHKYEPPVDSFVTLNNMVNNTHVGANNFALASNTYAGSGVNTGTTHERYNVGIGTWSALTALPTTHTHANMVHDSMVVAGVQHGMRAGGQSGGAVVTVGFSAGKYLVSGDSWSALTIMAAGRGFGIGFAINGFIYGVQGSTGGATFLNTNEKYDPSADTWSSDTAAISSVTNPGKSTLSQQTVGVSIGGNTGLPGAAAWSDTMETFDGTAWTARSRPWSALLGGHQLCGGDGLANGKAYMMGGTYNGSGSSVDDLFKDYVIDTFSTLTSIATLVLSAHQSDNVRAYGP